MSSAEGKADVQVTRLGHIFPFGGSSTSPLPHLTQCCRFSIPERLPLQPFRQDRLQRLPLPPSLMAASSKTVSLTGAGGTPALRGQYNDIDPLKKIVQLEKNIAFIQEGHSLMLKSLHEEISDLKQKNRELHFQLITGYSAQPPELLDKDEVISPKAQEKIEKLEKEVRKLHSALKDALKTNTTITNELHALKRERCSLSSSNAVNSHTKVSKNRGSNSHVGRTPHGSSPEMEDYSDTLRQIQRAAGTRNSKSSDTQHVEHSNHYWSKGGSGYLENRRGHSYYHHHMMQQSHDTRHRQQQPRLPRLPLRNQLQNYVQHNQYEIQYQHRTSSILPSLKQSEQNRQNKQRKPRGPQQAKVADHVYNH